jgi:hypothetical protein
MNYYINQKYYVAVLQALNTHLMQRFIFIWGKTSQLMSWVCSHAAEILRKIVRKETSNNYGMIFKKECYNESPLRLEFQ